MNTDFLGFRGSHRRSPPSTIHPCSHPTPPATPAFEKLANKGCATIQAPLLAASYLRPTHSPPAPVSLDPVMPFVCPPLCQAQDPKGQIQNPFNASGASKLLFGLTSRLFPYPCQSPWLLQLRTAPPPLQPQLPSLHTTYKQALACCPSRLQDFPLSLSISSHRSAIPAFRDQITWSSSSQSFLSSHHPFKFLPGQNVPLSKYSPTLSVLLAISAHSSFLEPGHEECIISCSSYSLSCPQHHAVVKKKHTHSECMNESLLYIDSNGE